MKILIACPMPPAPQAPGAIPLVLNSLINGLRPRHELTLVTVAGPDPAEWQALDRLQALGIDVQAVRRTELAGLPRWRRRARFATAWLRGFYPWRTIWFWEPEIQRILDRLLATEAYSLVLVEDNAMGIYRYRTRVPVFMTEHEVRKPRQVDWGRLNRANWLGWMYSEFDWSRWPRYQAGTWRRFDCVQTFTERDAAIICSMTPELASRVRVNPFGIDLPRAMPSDCEKAGELLFVGNYTHPPNVDAALWLGREIMPLLREQAPGAHLNLVGACPPKEVLQLEYADIHVTGPVPEIEPYFEEAAVVLAPLRTGNGMRMKVLQSLALGKAVVTTPRGAEGLAFNGQPPPLVTAGDAAGLARAAAELLANPEARRALGRKGRAFVQEIYSPQAYVQRLEANYAELKV